jgi:zinc finger protein
MSEVQSMFINPDEPVTQIESFCPSCEGQGMTRLLLCSIPFFKEVVVMSFNCDHCGYRNNEVQSAGSLAEKGIKITLYVRSTDMLNREIVKSEWASVTIPEIELEIPPTTQKACFSTVEGILTKTYEDLNMLQPERRLSDPISGQKIDDFLEKLKNLKHTANFTLILDDPSGNSYISSDISKHKLPINDPDLKIESYNRTREQMITMGYLSDDQEPENPIEESKEDPKAPELPISAQGHDFSQPLESSKITEEVIEMQSRCFACYKPGTIKTCITSIPHFKETVIMAFSCDFCGATSNEIKGGGEISENARKITLVVKTPLDLSRFIIKSDTCSLTIPEIGLELTPGTLGSQATTLEGLLGKIYEELDKNIGFVIGDSQESEERKRFVQFMESLKQMKRGLHPEYTFIMNDSLSNSYVAGIGESDDQLIVEDYKRSEEQNEELGISDMNTDDY